MSMETVLNRIGRRSARRRGRSLAGVRRSPLLVECAAVTLRASHGRSRQRAWGRRWRWPSARDQGLRYRRRIRCRRARSSAPPGALRRPADGTSHLPVEIALVVWYLGVGPAVLAVVAS